MALQRTELLIGRGSLQPGALTLQGIQLGLGITQSYLADIAASSGGVETCPELCSLPVDSAETTAGLITRDQRLAGARALVLRLGAALRRSDTLLGKFGLLILVARSVAARGCATNAA